MDETNATGAPDRILQPGWSFTLTSWVRLPNHPDLVMIKNDYIIHCVFPLSNFFGDPEEVNHLVDQMLREGLLTPYGNLN